PTAFADGLGDDALAVGDDSGSVRLGTVRFSSAFLDPAVDDVTAYESLKPGQMLTEGEGVVARSPQGQLRREAVVTEFAGEPVEVSAGSEVLRLDRVDTDGGPVLVAWSTDG